QAVHTRRAPEAARALVFWPLSHGKCCARPAVTRKIFALPAGAISGWHLESGRRAGRVSGSRAPCRSAPPALPRSRAPVAQPLREPPRRRRREFPRGRARVAGDV